MHKKIMNKLLACVLLFTLLFTQFSFVGTVFAEESTSEWTNIALNKPATSSKADKGDIASNAVDGNESTRWYDADNAANGNWLAVDLQEVYDISNIEIVWDPDPNGVYAPQFEIRTSEDGVSYDKTVYTGTSENGAPQSFEVSARTRYVQLYISEHGKWGTAVFEFKVFGKQSGTPEEPSAPVEWPQEEEENPVEKVNLALNKPASASIEAVDQGVHRVAGMAVDGNEGTRWYDGDASTETGNWWQVDLGQTYGLDEIDILWSNDTVSKKYEIQVSDDGANWKHIYTVDSVGMFGGDLRHNFQVYGSGRYIRVYILNRGTWGNSISEFAVYSSEESKAGNHIDAEDGELVAGAGGDLKVAELANACGGKYVDGFYLDTATANDGAGVKFTPENLFEEARTYLLTLGYARYLYEKEDTIGIYVNDTRVKTVKLVSETDNVNLTIRSAPVELMLKAGDTVTVKVDAAEGDHGYLRLDYVDLGVKINRPSREITLLYPHLSLEVNETAKIFANYEKNAEAEIEYFTEDPTVVSLTGDVATALKEGETRLMARVKASPLVYAIGRVTVGSAPEGAVVPVRGVALKEDALTVVNRESVKAEVAITPETAGTHLLWESSDPQVVSVAGGKIQGLSEGTATVTVKSALNEAISDSLQVTVTPNDTLDTIRSNELEVLISKNFPMVYQYQALQSGGIVQGNPNSVNQIAINGKNYTPKVTYEKVSDAQAKYTLTVTELNAVITMTLKAEESNFKLDVTEIKEDGADDKRIFTFDMPNNVMLSMTNKDAQASFAGSKMESSIEKTGDVLYNLKYHNTVDSKADTGFLYAFLSNDKVSAGFRGNAMDNRILKQTTKLGDTYITSLWSGAWRYRAADYTKTFQDTEGDYGAKNEVVTKTYKASYTEALPLIYISFAQGDLNDSGAVDWQDGAIAFRDIMATTIGMEQIPDAVVQRLVFPQSGEGNYPYISSLDETKRVYLATDGLGQLVLNKYHNEGTWGDLGVYDNSLGGHVDFNKYVTDATQKYNSWVGVHSNFTEIFAKARSFRPEKIMMQQDGVTPVGGGFAAYGHWLQQVYTPDVTYDAMSLERQRDLVAFKNAVPDLGFVYSDVFSGGGWKGRRLAEDYKEAGLSYFVEWPYQNEEEAVWSHWAVEKVYSPASLKAYASDIARFIFNHTKDRWDNNADCDTRNPNSSNLLMGADTTTYEGWPQANTNNSFNKSIQVVFDNNLPTKYMQHFPILRMEKDAEGWATHIWFEQNVEVYLDENGKRIIEKDGKVLYNQQSYLIPWDEGDINSSGDEEKEVKLYHWNENGGTTTWELPDSWNGLGTVVLYRLTDLGRVEEKELQVKNGTVTIEDAEAKTPYVVYKGEAASSEDVNYGDGSYVKDPGFNYGDLRAWTVEKGSPAVKKNDTEFDDPNTPNWLRDAPFGEQRNYELVIDGTDETQISQKITGLTPGQYAASVMVEVQQGKERKASILIDNGEKVYTSYTTKSILMDFDEYDSKLGTYMLRMRVNFEVPEGGDSVLLTLHAAAGEGKVRFDNVRVFKTTLPTPDPENVTVQDKVIFYQDFELAKDENSTDPLTPYKPTYEAYYPFNLGAARAIHETRVSIQQGHAPFTNNGTTMWDPTTVSLDDTLAGERAIKVIGIGSKGIAVQTLPQNIRFEEGKQYRVSFKYQTQPADDYAFVLGDGQQSGLSSAERQNPDNLVYKETLSATSQTKVYSHEFTASSDQLWFGIYRQKVSISVSDNPAPLVIDDILVEEIENAADRYTVVYKSGAGDATGAAPTQNPVAGGVEITLAENTFTRSGYVFAGWSDGEATYQAGDRYTVTDQNVVFTALWEEAPPEPQNIALNKPASASKEAQNHAAGSAFDGVESDSSRWYDGDNQNNGNWLAVDLQGVYDIDQINIVWAGGGVHAPKYELQVSNDGVNYTKIHDGAAESEAPQSIQVSATGRYVRLYVVEHGKWGTSVQEMKVFGAAVDSSALQALYDEYKDMTNSNYTEESWNAFQAALAVAASALDGGSQEQVDAAYSALLAAKKALAPKADFTALNRIVEEYGSLNEKDYTAESWSAFQTVLAEAKTVLGNADATQGAVDNAYNNLVAARIALVELIPADKTELDALIAATDKIDTSNSRPGKLAAYKDALAHAKEISEKADATQDEVNAASDALLEAIVNLKDIVDKTNLNNLMNILSQLKAEDYTAESFAVLTEALAQAALIDDDSSVAEVTAAYKGLQAANAQLVRVPKVNKEALANAIKKAQIILDNLDSFKPNSVIGLQEALNKAQAVYDDPAATQAQVKEATDALTAANAKAQVKEDKEVLFKAIQKAEALNAKDYTAESFAELTRVLAAAKLVAQDDNAGKEQVAAAAKSIESAIAKLQKAGDGSGNGSSSTGDSGNVWPAALALMISMLGVAAVTIVRKKRAE